jgi:Zn-dependent protease
LTPEHIANALTTYVVLLFSLSVHESAHAWMAHRLGDDTAFSLGRVSLNPLVHIDPIGTVIFPLIQMFTGVPLIGWAKPTPYNPANFRRDVSLSRGHILVAMAGPGSNLMLAVLFLAATFAAARAGAPELILYMLGLGVLLNAMLAVFNVIPIVPLDGSKLASWGLPRGMADQYDAIMGPYGFMILLALFYLGLFDYVLRPVAMWVSMLVQMVS